MMEALKNMDLVKEMTLPMLVVSVYASLGGMGFGIDYNYWAGFLGMAKFKRDFGVYDDTLGEWIIPSTWQSIATGTPTAGLAVGALVSGFIGHKLGRLRTFFVAAIIGFIGILIQAASIGNFWQLMVGRIINAISLGIICNVVPTYQSECAPVKIRGSLINCYQFFLLVGATLVQTANWGLNEREDQWAYRVVLILQFIVPILLLVGSFVLPESPRWLVGKNRREASLKVLQLLRRGSPEEVIEKEVDLLMRSEEEQASLSKGSSWVDCFRGPNLRRTAIAAGMQCMQAAQGNGFISNYSVTFLQGVGITDEYKIAVLLTFTNTVASAFAFYFADKLGRRVLILISAAVMAIGMFAIAGVTGFGKTGSADGALAGLFIWQIFQAIGWSSCVWIVTAEVPTLRVREKTITIATFSGFSINVLVTYIAPYIQNPGYGNLEGKIGFIWGAFSIVAFVWAFLFVPELKGRSLEELDELFENKVPTLRFGSYVCVGYGAQLTLAEEVAHMDQDSPEFENGVQALKGKAVEAQEGVGSSRYNETQ